MASSLGDLYTNVVAGYTARVSTVPHFFGWRAEDFTNPQTRISWIPGSLNGSFGKVGPPVRLGHTPPGVRQLAAIREEFYVVICGADLTDVSNELLQYEKVRCLFDEWWREVILYAGPRVQYSAGEWILDKKVLRYGAGMRVSCTIEAVISREGAITEVAQTDADADVGVTELDFTENFSVG